MESRKVLAESFARMVPFEWLRLPGNDNPALAGLSDKLSMHGLRKAAARRLAEAGCTTHEIASITGHKTLSEIERYTREAEQTRLARTASGKVVQAFGEKHEE